ncbi:MAG TPA: CRISPR-associated endonuclease Cas1 [Candidatus Paceibacterota bacterium]|nr:CRISPR-associated endonuclease Cas1 [Verrucomicrobiota bacterium]HOX03617.1 CRISPR-associated endonuclease Cas1 [Verrucomicrobiota bacterium]HRZ46664.1 CRISPR-associated endonuclease Cas1 [Candidatus Paceibacterota bacterium]HRZ54933.1 CRISPR-associated endonuclease Cas1 [Candidatus Paceibacterota bacterium]
MLNEFVYCPRLFYLEFVECLFVESADTLRGSALHARVDQGAGGLPKPGPGTEKPASSIPPESQPAAEGSDVIHSRSVSLGSDRLGVSAKIDLVEVRMQSWPGSQGELFPLPEVCPVDYKAGSPRPGADGNDLWDTDRMQLGLQALILRHNGYLCTEGVIYYRATRQRVRLPITDELVEWIRERIGAARRCAAGPMPPPLADSPKCVRCSLAPVCLPDETRLLAGTPSPTAARRPPEVRRLMAPRDDRRALYLNTQGLRIGRKDEVLQIKDTDGQVDEVRLRDVNHVALFGNCQISTQAVQALCFAEIPVTYFSTGGWFYGLTRGHELKNVFLRIEQFRRSHDDAFALALSRRFVQGKIRNQRTLLMRNHIEPPAAAVARLKYLAEKALTAAGQDALLGLEGAAASVYFEHFDGMLKPSDELDGTDAGWRGRLRFDFVHRNRRPPTDPVNALLSLAYSVLAKDCTIAALAVGFDPYVGFYHQPRFGRPALALDLMEEFRPLIAESAVLTCINNRVLSPSDFVRAGHAVNLSPAGRKRFFQTYEQRINSLLTHPMFDYKVSYRRMLELQARLLAKTLTGEIVEYCPLTTR